MFSFRSGMGIAVFFVSVYVYRIFIFWRASILSFVLTLFIFKAPNYIFSIFLFFCFIVFFLISLRNVKKLPKT